MKRPIALTIAGSDSSGGAGIQADLKTFSAFGVYGASAITSLTAQNTHGVTGIFPVEASFVASQIDAVATDLRVGAVKTGMLGEKTVIETVASALRRHNLAPLVIDPVMVATTGARLLAAGDEAALRETLLPLADLVTPNLLEAACLLSCAAARNEDEQREQAVALLKLGPRAVLLKGGHAHGGEAVDIFANAAGVERLALARVKTRHTHGTGCTLSAAITALLAKGHSPLEAVRESKRFVTDALVAGRDMDVGTGSGPVDHLIGQKSPDSASK